MPSTEANIDLIAVRLSHVAPEAILSAYNEMQTIIYNQDCDQMIKLDPITGMPPYFVTTGVQYYECPIDCRRTAAIVEKKVMKPYTSSYGKGIISQRGEFFFRDTKYQCVLADTRDATIDQLAKVYLQEDLGATTDRYYHIYYVKPTPITGLSVQLQIPEELHYMVREAVVAQLTSDEYGKSQFDEALVNKIKKEVRKAMNRGFRSNYGTTRVQEQFQD
jgi:hypothetical protein